MWQFSTTYDASHPRVQRDMLKFCGRIPKVLRVTNGECWMQNFRGWLVRKRQRFPTTQLSYHKLATQYANEEVIGQRMAISYFWVRNSGAGKVAKASYFSFNADLHYLADPEVALDYKKHWDDYLKDWNQKPSPLSRGAFHTSKLWQTAQAQQELISSTITTLIVLVGLSFL